MTLRSTRSSVTFAEAFDLKGVGGIQPAGTYDVDVEEEAIETVTRTVYVRVATLFHIRDAGVIRTITVDPKDLEAALQQDRPTN